MPSRFVPVESFASEIDASIAKGRLEAAGIPCQIRLSRMGDALLGAVGLLNGPRDAWVREGDAARALDILREKAP